MQPNLAVFPSLAKFASAFYDLLIWIYDEKGSATVGVCTHGNRRAPD